LDGITAPEALLNELIVGVSAYPISDILPPMTKRLIDVDDAKLAAVQSLLGTPTMKATVDAAFDEVLALDARRRALLIERGVDTSGMADSAARRAAWG